jgi:hypothetical protein
VAASAAVVPAKGELVATSSSETLHGIAALMQIAASADGVQALVSDAVPYLVEIVGSPSLFLAAKAPRSSEPFTAGQGLDSEALASLAATCGRWLEDAGDGERSSEEPQEIVVDGASYRLDPLIGEGRRLGIVVTPAGSRRDDVVWSSVLMGLSSGIARIVESTEREKRLLHLNTYLTVSSMLARSVDLAELLEIALFCSMEAVNAEAASILLLDDARESFRFFRVEGPAKPLLGGSTFPITAGVAGRVLDTLQAEIVNDARQDAQFYGEIDRETGFRTRNMIAVPLVAGEERVGVLEVLNKTDGGSFTADERLILESVAEEIAFAVRNATLLDYVVNTYCKRRQGQNSCKGCERPLGSWTPCMRYREFLP